MVPKKVPGRYPALNEDSLNRFFSDVNLAALIMDNVPGSGGGGT